MTNPIDAAVSRIVEGGTPLNILLEGKLDSARVLNQMPLNSVYWSRENEERNGQMTFG